MDKNPDVLRQTVHVAVYRADLKKASLQVRSVANFFTNAALIVEEQIVKLDEYRYPTARLQQIVNAIKIIQDKLVEEGQKIDQKSKFPPQA